MKKAYLICNNDSIECVIIDDEFKALDMLKDLKKDSTKESFDYLHIHVIPVAN